MAIPTISSEEALQRREDLDCVLGTTAAEGEAPSVEARALFELYAVGELSLEDVGIELNRLHHTMLGRVIAA